MTPLSPLLFDRLPVWQVIGRNTQITWNWELISVDLGGGSEGIDYPSGLTNLGLFFFHLSMKLFGRRRIKLEVGHVSASHGIMEEGPSFILALTPHLLQLSANLDLPDSL